MEALSGNNRFSTVNNNYSGEQKLRKNAGNTGFCSANISVTKKPAFGATNEGLGKKAVNLILKGVDKFQKCIENGGFFYEFLAVDFLGMILPRTYQAYHRNEEELGHPNTKAAAEEFIREILSGPSLFLIPLGFLKLSKRMFGASSHIKRDLFENLSEVSKNLVKNKDKNPDLVRGFYENVVEKLYGKNPKVKTGEIVDGFVSLHNADSKDAEGLKAALTEKLTALNKLIGIDKEHGISLEDSSKIKFEGITKKVGEFVEDFHNYSTDVINSLSAAKENAGEQLVDQIHTFKGGARKLIAAVAIGTTAAFLNTLPKLYQRSKQYPGLDGLALSDKTASSDLKKEGA